MTELTYTGPHELAVNGVGSWLPGESKRLDDTALANSLLARPDFIPTPRPVRTAAPVKKTAAKAKNPA